MTILITDRLKRRVVDRSFLVECVKANCETTSFCCVRITFNRTCSYIQYLLALIYIFFTSKSALDI